METITTTKELEVYVKARVDAGSSWLDKKLPGWEAMIDLDKLNMINPNKCVLGQTIGYSLETTKDVDCSNLGFCGDSAGVRISAKTDPRYPLTLYMKVLGAAWKEEIRRRRN